MSKRFEGMVLGIWPQSRGRFLLDGGASKQLISVAGGYVCILQSSPKFFRLGAVMNRQDRAA